MKLTVLHAIPSLVGGGAERQLALLAPELCRLGVTTHVAYVHPGVNLSALQASPVGLHSVACASNHDPRILLKLLHLIHNLRPHIVQTWLPQMDILGGLAALFSRKPLVLSERSSAGAYTGGWKNLVRRQIGRRANAIVANSYGGVNYWREADVERRVIRNGLALQSLQASGVASPATLGLPADARVILFAGRLSVEKNIAMLLAALDPVLCRHPDVVAVLFGEGPLSEELHVQISKLTMRNRLRLNGFTTDIWCWMRRASAFVSVSLFEGNPNAVLEAMALGCPVVVSSIAQHHEILDEKSAYFCDPTSAADIACAIDAVLTDPRGGAAKAVVAQQTANGLSIENAAHEYLSLYRELSSSRTSAHRRVFP